MLRELKLTSDRHTVELEMTMRALRKGARVVEAATHEYPRRFGRSSLSVTRQGPLFLGTICASASARCDSGQTRV